MADDGFNERLDLVDSQHHAGPSHSRHSQHLTQESGIAQSNQGYLESRAGIRANRHIGRANADFSMLRISFKVTAPS